MRPFRARQGRKSRFGTLHQHYALHAGANGKNTSRLHFFGIFFMVRHFHWHFASTMTPDFDAARSHFFDGIAHFESGRYLQAHACFRAALEHAPGRASVIGNLGITLFHLNRHQEALPLLQQAVAADPVYTQAWACLGLCQEVLGNWNNAIVALERALMLNPNAAPLALSLGRCLGRNNQAGQALAAFERALSQDESLGEAWSAKGGLLREAGQHEAAAHCFERAIACGFDPDLNAYYLAAVRGGADAPPPVHRYVESLFDDYAPAFQEHVVHHLHYRGFEILLRPLVEQQRRFDSALDLGCGTGLCGPMLSQLAGSITGVDLSQAMLAQARNGGHYNSLIHADIQAYLSQDTAPVDLIVAADVFIYVGPLEELFPAARHVLNAGGCFAFTVEEASDAVDVQLLPSLRYAHSERYVRNCAAQAGFTVSACQRAALRVEQGKTIMGLYCYLS